MVSFDNQILKGAAVLTFGHVAGYGLSFVRNMILARVLTRADFGLAAAVSLSLSLLDLVARMAFGKQIVQVTEGDQPEYQGAAHAMQAVVGMLSAVLVFAGASPIAAAFGHPDLEWAFATMAIVPLARGFMHLDIARIQRRLAFGPQAVAEFLPQVAATLVAWPVAMWLADFRAVLWIVLGKELLTLALSHCLAERPYRWNRPGVYLGGMWRFGWPLLLNGMVMFAAQQGDQMLIGVAFSMEDLATYAIAFTLSSVPWAVFSQVGTSLMLPLLSRHQNDLARFELHYRHCLAVSVIGSMLAVGPIIVGGGWLIRLFYGSKYAGLGPLATVFGVTVAVRLFRWAPALGAMARAETLNLLIGNLCRVISLPLAMVLLALGAKDLLAVAACGVVGEAVATAISIHRVSRYQGIRLSVHWRPLALLMGWLSVAVVLRGYVTDTGPAWVCGIATLVLWLLGAAAAVRLFPKMLSLCRQTGTELLPSFWGMWR